jgi:hypothetical protein
VARETDKRNNCGRGEWESEMRSEGHFIFGEREEEKSVTFLE